MTPEAHFMAYGMGWFLSDFRATSWASTAEASTG